jgi:tRNA dimethylallyltransferase
MARIVALVGPTGVGKTDVGIALAAQLGAEIINADSRQVFRQLDIGSAKPTTEQRAAVPHHVIDVVDPDMRFDCAQFRRLAVDAISDITRRGKRVLVVGGTGLYVKVLLRGLLAGPARDPGLRARLQQREDAAPGSLHGQLAAVDPATAARLHRHDRVRLIRALEVHALTGRPMSAWQSEHGFGQRAFDALVLGLALPRATLYARIEARCHAMIAAGLVDEIRHLYAAGFDPKLPALRSPGYREIGDHVRDLCDLPTAVARMAQATRRLAKRQMTWFRGDAQVEWHAPELAAVQPAVERFWGTR